VAILESKFGRKGENAIFSKFQNLETEKQERILNAAMKEFAKKGYKNASTNEIVKEAAISKGALFHYFKNKKELFLFLYDYSVEYLTNEILKKFNYEEGDIFLRMEQIMMLKIENFKRHPQMYDFFLAAYMEDCDEVKSELESKNKVITESGYSKIYEGIDFSKFRETIDVKKAIEIINWTLEGFSNREAEKLKNFSYEESDELLKEINTYLEILKKSFYK